nr:type II toxin-antitoxin system HicA family toxin [Frankia sp. Cj3]
MARIHGSHQHPGHRSASGLGPRIMKHEDGRRTTVPVHGGRDIPPGTLPAVLRDAGLTIDDLHGLL